MPQLVKQPSIIKSVGTKPKIIREIFGRINSNNSGISIAQMSSPKGWEEPGQKPEFDEYTIVINGQLVVQTEGEKNIIIEPGQGVFVEKGEWVRYSTPNAATEYIAICIPAFSSDTVNRDN